MAEPRPITVLFVDDDEVNRYAGGRLLRLAGFQVLDASNSAEALALLDRRPDIAVVDVHLPDMDGFALCRAIKSRPDGGIPVLLVSARFTSTEDQVYGLEGGADGYLAQPFELPVLRATIIALMRVREAEETARKLSAQWQSTFDAINDGIWILDAAGRILRCNRAMARQWQRAPEELQGMPARELDEGLPDGEGEHEVQRGEHWYRVACHSLPGGAEQGRIQVWSDITARKHAELERLRLLEGEQAARLQAEEANRTKDEFLATLSHELRTPLMAILGWVGILGDESVTREQLATGLDVIERNARTQTQIINDLLDISRVVAGKIQLNLQPLDLHQVIEAALHTVRPAAELKAVELRHDRTGTPCPVTGDAARLQQILWNLLSNAVKFTPRGGTVTVSCQSNAQETTVSVTDTGMGIAPGFLPHVFDRFRQEDSSSTRRHGGLGLGLAIVRHFMELHGGSATAHSEGEGRGTTFILHFPASAAPETRPADGAAADTSGLLQGKRVLLVDDQEETRHLLQVIFASKGAAVETRASAPEALEALTAWRPHLLVSDLGMPVYDGFWLIRQIRALPADQGGETAALALSAYADAGHRQKALDAGFHEFAAKPLSGEDLLQVAGRLLESRAA